jgi:hypothetical protein
MALYRGTVLAENLVSKNKSMPSGNEFVHGYMSDVVQGDLLRPPDFVRLRARNLPARLPSPDRAAVLGGMDQERKDYADEGRRLPPLWLVAGVLAVGVAAFTIVVLFIWGFYILTRPL